jgi:hypothetical protein
MLALFCRRLVTSCLRTDNRQRKSLSIFALGRAAYSTSSNFRLAHHESSSEPADKPQHSQARKEELHDHARQHYQANKEKIKQQKERYRDANRDIINQRARQYKEANREKFNQIQQRYREANRDRINQRARQYREANREKFNQNARKWREANRDRINQRVRQYREANKEKIKQQDKRYREANRDRIKQRYEQYREANRDKINQNARKWREANKEKVKQQDIRYREANRDRIKQKYQQYREANRERVNQIRQRYREANIDKIKEKLRQYREANREELRRKSRARAEAHPDIAYSRAVRHYPQQRKKRLMDKERRTEHDSALLEKAKAAQRLKYATDQHYRQVRRLYQWVFHGPGRNLKLTWPTHQPIFYSDLTTHHCTGCRHGRLLKAWWKQKDNPDGYDCHPCFTNDWSRALPFGYQDKVFGSRYNKGTDESKHKTGSSP